MKRRWSHLFALTFCLTVGGCVANAPNQVNENRSASPLPSATTSPSPEASPSLADSKASTQSLTLPVLDAFFAEESFAETLKTRLQLTHEQVSKLKDLAHSETAKLNEENAGKDEQVSTIAGAETTEKISALMGAEKTRQLGELVGELWSGAADESSDKNAGQVATANAVPTDSRIVVNIPAYRMDVFDSGRLIKSYKIGIGYPEFPLPT